MGSPSRAGPLDGLSGRIATDGTFAVEASAPLPLQGSASGTLSGSELSADLSIAALDLTLLNDPDAHVGGDGSGRIGNRNRAPRTARSTTPRCVGTLQATGVVLDSSLIPQRVGPLAFPVDASRPGADGGTHTLGAGRRPGGGERDGAARAVGAGRLRLQRADGYRGRGSGRLPLRADFRQQASPVAACGSRAIGTPPTSRAPSRPTRRACSSTTPDAARLQPGNR